MISYLLLAAEQSSPTGWQAIVEGRGIAISLTGMAIVFAALVIIALFIASVPHVLAWLDPLLPKMHAPHAPPARQEQSATDQERIVAAIGLVLHTETQKLLRESK